MADGAVTTLYGRILVRAAVQLESGLHIGAGTNGAIPGLEFTVVRDPLSGQPYLPGSSLRGKMRAETERLLGLLPNTSGRGGVQVYVPMSREEYDANPIGRLYGVPGTRAFAVDGAARLIVRDVFLAPESAAALKRARTDLPYTEVKSEASVDRVTAEPAPRQIERLPAGARLAPLELVYSVYSARDLADFGWVVRGLQLVEDSYLGGHGSRGSGKVRFVDFDITVRSRASYRGEVGAGFSPRRYPDVAALLDNLEELTDAIRSALALPA
ncbi:MAG: type III-A CRISPR-associated RAMP protein Csm3 [Chloroflexota bacterium]|nr:type III-A CRISPR-associated RAMP protein Csm3 [Dehalococcoidia bacterium]MDW8254186.1 type III-A CRISPR-associated RAMP protein Csm3 [Chloroflexota bacterium]